MVAVAAQLAALKKQSTRAGFVKVERVRQEGAANGGAAFLTRPAPYHAALTRRGGRMGMEMDSVRVRREQCANVIEVDQTVLKQVLDEARERIKEMGQWSWGNALEKAAEELRDDPAVEVEEEEEQMLALIYPPHERVGVTYRCTAATCQCEAHADGKPCRHRAKVRLVALCQRRAEDQAPLPPKEEPS